MSEKHFFVVLILDLPQVDLKRIPGENVLASKAWLFGREEDERAKIDIAANISSGSLSPSQNQLASRSENIIFLDVPYRIKTVWEGQKGLEFMKFMKDRTSNLLDRPGILDSFCLGRSVKNRLS